MSTPTAPKVLVTGSEGFLGSRLQVLLAEQGIQTVKYDLALGHDVQDAEALRRVVDAEPGLVGVIHLAAVANLNYYHKAPLASKSINIGGTHNVLEAARRRGLWVFFASTCCAYGNNHCHPSDETSPLSPTEPYAASKALMEPVVLQADPGHVVMRLATFYGPHMRPQLSVAKFMHQIWHGETVSVHGDGSATRTLTHCDDIARGIVTLVLAKGRGTLLHRVYNITTEESVSILDQVREIGAATGRVPRVAHVEDRPFQIQREEILSRRLRDLGWAPRFSFAQGVRDCFRQFERDGYAWRQSCGVAPTEATWRTGSEPRRPDAPVQRCGTIAC